MTQTTPAPPRSTAERREHALAQLAGRHEVWLATGSQTGPHLIPVCYVWDGSHLTMATFEHSPTVANLRANGTARVAIGHHDDITMIDGTVELVPVAEIEPGIADAFAKVSHDPRVLPGFVYLRLTPGRVQVWNGFHEFAGRTVMRDGSWSV
ncbi:pyridoxamine 5'-phosphate oxidase family protein [Flindersiella endophytica]